MAATVPAGRLRRPGGRAAAGSAAHGVGRGYISTTTTKTGLSVHAELLLNEYPTGTKITDDEMAALSLTRHETLPKLNYTLSPNTSKS